MYPLNSSVCFLGADRKRKEINQIKQFYQTKGKMTNTDIEVATKDIEIIRTLRPIYTMREFISNLIFT